MRTALVTANLLLIVCGGALAQDLKTGPPHGTPLTAVHCYVNSGPFRGREFDAAKVIGKGNGALLFIHQLHRNGIPTMRAMDDFAAQYGILDFKSFTLLLSDDRTSAENRLKAINGSLKMRNPMVLCLDGPEGPGNLALNRKCMQSLLMIRQGKVVKSIALTDIADEDRERVRLWIEEITGPLPVQPRDYLKLVERKLPTDPVALRQFVREQSVELHRVHAELEVATRGISKYGGKRNNMRRPTMNSKAPARARDGKPSTKSESKR